MEKDSMEKNSMEKNSMEKNSMENSNGEKNSMEKNHGKGRMKIAVYEVRKDELQAFEKMQQRYPVELVLSEEIPGNDNLSLLEGCEGVSILGQGKIDRALLSAWKSQGIRFLSTRTIGYNHIDIQAAKALGIRVCSAAYPPNGVADFTVMMILMCLRNYKQAMWRGQVNDFSLEGLQGRDMNSLTIGVVGTGRIGLQVIKNLSGFGCRLLACDRYQNPQVQQYAEYVELETIYKECDVISLHMPLTEETWHAVNRETIAKMKDGVILINCARGELTDIDALVEGIENEKIGALGMDTVEGEEGIIHADHRTDILSNRNWFYLHQFRNVIMTQHMAFYTEQAVENMVRCGVEGLVQMKASQKCPTEITDRR